MPLSYTSMADRIEGYQAAVSDIRTSDPAEAAAFARKSLEGFCKGVIEEITENGRIHTTSGAPDGEHTGGIS